MVVSLFYYLSYLFHPKSCKFTLEQVWNAFVYTTYGNFYSYKHFGRCTRLFKTL